MAQSVPDDLPEELETYEIGVLQEMIENSTQGERLVIPPGIYEMEPDWRIGYLDINHSLELVADPVGSVIIRKVWGDHEGCVHIRSSDILFSSLVLEDMCIVISDEEAQRNNNITIEDTIFRSVYLEESNWFGASTEINIIREHLVIQNCQFTGSWASNHIWNYKDVLFKGNVIEGGKFKFREVTECIIADNIFTGQNASVYLSNDCLNITICNNRFENCETCLSVRHPNDDVNNIKVFDNDFIDSDVGIEIFRGCPNDYEKDNNFNNTNHNIYDGDGVHREGDDPLEEGWFYGVVSIFILVFILGSVVFVGYLFKNFRKKKKD